MAAFGASLVFGIMALMASAERAASPQDKLHTEQGAPHEAKVSAVVGAKGMKGMSSLAENNAVDAKQVPASLVEATENSTLKKGVDDPTAPEQNTFGSCKWAHCSVKRRGVGVLCDKFVNDKSFSCVCALGFHATGTEGETKQSDSSKGVCEPDEGELEAVAPEGCDPGLDTPDDKKFCIVKYGASSEERAEAVRKRVTKQVGKCSTFHCSSSRSPDNADGGGVGCNQQDDTCYCMAKGYFAYNEQHDRRANGMYLPKSNDYGKTVCKQLSEIPEV